ncbi:MAG: thioredoxin domain-containing protein, partial [Gammaproteobacteria bacterium]
HWSASKADGQALTMASLTLQAMANGGIYDQLGGGFCRYSVDEQWMIPHFEKMLYDNGLLLSLYAQAWAATNDPLFKRIAVETAQWIMREMQSAEGGYYSSLDADSEGHEGKFYAWSQDEVHGLLDEQEYTVFATRFGLDRSANFDVHGSTSVAGGRTPGATEGKWHLHVFADTLTIAHELNLSETEAIKILDAARAKLLKVREERVHPGRDEKILTSWNALMIKGMAIAGRILNEPEFIRSAERSLQFIKTTLWNDGRLLATYKDGRAHLMAYLDDYAYLLDAVLELLQVRWRSDDLNFAIQLAEVLLTHFEDQQHGGFYFTAADHERLIHRPKPLADDATPSGNGIATYSLNRLGHLLGETRYLDAAERTLKAAWTDITRAPYAHDSMLLALEEILSPPQIIILRGEADAMQPWQQHADEAYAPHRLVMAIPTDAQDLPGALAERKPKGAVIAYVCEGVICSAPINKPAEFQSRLKLS